MDTPLRSVYVPHIDQVLVKISVLGIQYPYHCTDGVTYGMASSMPNFIPSVQRVAPAGAKDLKIGL